MSIELAGLQFDGFAWQNPHPARYLTLDHARRVRQAAADTVARDEGEMALLCRAASPEITEPRCYSVYVYYYGSDGPVGAYLYSAHDLAALQYIDRDEDDEEQRP